MLPRRGAKLLVRGEDGEGRAGACFEFIQALAARSTAVLFCDFIGDYMESGLQLLQQHQREVVGE